MFAPWELGRVARWAPAALRPRLARHVLEARGARVVRVPGHELATLALRAWSSGKTDRQLGGRFALRAAMDLVAASSLPDGVTRLVAPSCGARLCFAAARTRWPRAARVLVHDLPVLPALHADLERAREAHPESTFLSRYRASHAVVTRQRAEWALATRVEARGAWAASALRAWGCPSEVTAPDELRPEVPPRRLSRDGRWRLLLAGFAAARGGAYEALALLDRLPDATLVARWGDGAEPEALARHPRVRASTAREREAMEGIDAVLAPAWCEGYAPEVEAAVARAVPVVATERGRGRCRADATLPERVDAEAMRAALEALRG